MQEQLTKRQAEVLTALIEKHGLTEGKVFNRYSRVIGWSHSEYLLAPASVFNQLVKKGALVVSKDRFNCYERITYRFNLEFAKSFKSSTLISSTKA